MKVIINNFRGISHAEIDTAKITLFVADNFSGKTSAMQAIAAAKTGKVIPIEDVLKAHAGLLVHSGTACGDVVVKDDNGEITVAYPTTKRTVSGDVREISLTAAGLSSLVDIPKKDRIKAVCELLKAYPTKEQLTAELTKIASFDPKGIDRLWKTAEVQGWDAACDQAKETGTKLKGKWETYTGENYGTEKAPVWIPSTWEADLVTAKETELEAVLIQENEWLRAAELDDAISADKLAALRETVEELPSKRIQLTDLKSSLQVLRKTETDLKTMGRALPSAEQPKTQACPCCKEPLIISGTTITKAVVIKPEELVKRKADIARVSEQVIAATNKINATNADIAVLEAAIKSAETDEVQLKNILAKKSASSGTDTKAVDDCKARVLRAQSRLTAYKSKRDADKTHADFMQNQLIVSVLAPLGLRHTVLKTKLDSFNSALNALCTQAGWAMVELKQDMSITCHGTPYMLLSKSEMFRVRCILQIAIAKLTGDHMVMIDEADILDKNGRNGLFGLLNKIDIESIVAMTISRDKVPAIGKIGGVTYWIENGVAEKL